MSRLLCFSIRFLDPEPSFHGRADGGEPEWPPSPLRLFQALVDAAASRWRNATFIGCAKPALEWLQLLKPPTVMAPPRHVGVPFRIAVPNNDLDVWAGPISKGNVPKKQPNELKTMKTVRPTHLRGDAVHYLFPVNESDPEFLKHRNTLIDAARSITHLGWGVDMVAANATVISEEEADKLAGERWRPVDGTSANGLRVPVEGTLNDLAKKHTAFLNRLSEDGFKPVPPLSKFEVKGYRRASESSRRPFAAFSILKPDASGNQAFDTVRRARDVAAWVRYATGAVCEGWPFGSTERFVHGHDGPNKPLKGVRADERFMYLPLPTINVRLNRVESIRRVLIAAPVECQDRIDWIRRRLSGQELVWDGKPVGLLSILPRSDWVLRQYTDEARVWSTVTPVIWPGHDDHNPRKAEAILRKAFVDAGLSQEIVDGIEELDWRPVGFRAGLDLAHCYACPENLRGCRYHVRVRFAHSIFGPVVIGAGRYRGLGLLVNDQ